MYMNFHEFLESPTRVTCLFSMHTARAPQTVAWWTSWRLRLGSPQDAGTSHGFSEIHEIGRSELRS